MCLFRLYACIRMGVHMYVYTHMRTCPHPPWRIVHYNNTPHSTGKGNVALAWDLFKWFWRGKSLVTTYQKSWTCCATLRIHKLSILCASLSAGPKITMSICRLYIMRIIKDLTIQTRPILCVIFSAVHVWCILFRVRTIYGGSVSCALSSAGAILCAFTRHLNIRWDSIVCALWSAGPILYTSFRGLPIRGSSILCPLFSAGAILCTLSRDLTIQGGFIFMHVIKRWAYVMLGHTEQVTNNGAWTEREGGGERHVHTRTQTHTHIHTHVHAHKHNTHNLAMYKYTYAHIRTHTHTHLQITLCKYANHLTSTQDFEIWLYAA